MLSFAIRACGKYNRSIRAKRELSPVAALLLRMGRGAFRRVRNTDREYRSSGPTCIYFGNCRVSQAGSHLGLRKDETLYWTEKKQYVKIVIIMGICAH